VDDDTLAPLYWSNADGWVDRGSADIFTDAERGTLNLPMGGEWAIAGRERVKRSNPKGRKAALSHRLVGTIAEGGAYYFHGGRLASDGWVEMTQAQWSKIHRDYKGHAESWTEFGKMFGAGTKSVMVREPGGSALRPVRIVAQNRRKSRRSGHNVCTAGVRGKGRSNPRESVVARARRTFRRLNEIEPGRLTRVRGAANAPKVAVKLGELMSFTYRSDKYAGTPENPHGKSQLYEHRTKPPHPVIATDPDGREVHIVGGRMHPTADGLVN